MSSLKIFVAGSFVNTCVLLAYQDYIGKEAYIARLAEHWYQFDYYYVWIILAVIGTIFAFRCEKTKDQDQDQVECEDIELPDGFVPAEMSAEEIRGLVQVSIVSMQLNKTPLTEDNVRTELNSHLNRYVTAKSSHVDKIIPEEIRRFTK